MGQRRESMALSDDEKEVIAYHEAGHAVCAAVLAHADPVHKVTILPTGMALGVTQQLPVEERHIYRQDYIEDSLVVRMGGRCAEELVFGVISTGANNDLVGSTELARKMVREWGMSSRVGPMAWGSQGAGVPRRGPDPHPRLLRRDRPRHRRRGRADPARAGGALPRDAAATTATASTSWPGRCSSTRRSTAPRSPGSSPSATAARPATGDGDSGEPRDAETGIDIGPGRGPGRPCADPAAPRPPRRPRRQAATGAALSAPWSQPPAGRVPGSRSSATVAHRSVAVTGPRKVARTAPVGVGHDHRGHGGDPVAVVEGLGRRHLQLLDRDGVAGQVAGLVPHARAGGAGRRREHGHQPRRLGVVEVGPVELLGQHVGHVGRRRRPAAALDDDGGHDGHGHQHDDEGEAFHAPMLAPADPGGLQQRRQLEGGEPGPGRLAEAVLPLHGAVDHHRGPGPHDHAGGAGEVRVEGHPHPAAGRHLHDRRAGGTVGAPRQRLDLDPDRSGRGRGCTPRTSSRRPRPGQARERPALGGVAGPGAAVISPGRPARVRSPVVDRDPLGHDRLTPLVDRTTVAWACPAATRGWSP